MRVVRQPGEQTDEPHGAAGGAAVEDDERL
jgi:hypothetical protein